VPVSGCAAALRNWAISLAATAASTYALDACASAAGICLVASGLLAGLDHQWVVAFLVVSYALWGLGLRANVRVNWTLLATRGFSTNVLSKVAHDVTRRRTSNPRTLRLAAAAGYIGTEVAKEAPYYAAAFGAAAFSGSITSAEALIFIGGTNLGAGLYEYGLARLTRAFLRRFAAAEVATEINQGLRHRHQQPRPDRRRLRKTVAATRSSTPSPRVRA
jgi:hypothetical protein